MRKDRQIRKGKHAAKKGRLTAGNTAAEYNNNTEDEDLFGYVSDEDLRKYFEDSPEFAEETVSQTAPEADVEAAYETIEETEAETEETEADVEAAYEAIEETEAETEETEAEVEPAFETEEAEEETEAEAEIWESEIEEKAEAEEVEAMAEPEEAVEEEAEPETEEAAEAEAENVPEEAVEVEAETEEEHEEDSSIVHIEDIYEADRKAEFISEYGESHVSDKKVVMEVRNVSRTYKNGDILTPAVKGVSFDVYEGEFLLILGESGCGKTTLLNMLGGMDKPDAGEISCCGINLASASNKQLTKYRRNHIGFVFQSYNLMPNLTVKQNLEIIGELVKDPYKAADMLALVGLSDKKNSYPSQLSGGQQQRVSVARALIKKPDLLLADEPTAALDYQTGIEVLSVFEAIKEKGTTIIMISHNDEIAKMADRVLKIKDGRISSIQENEHPVHAKDLEW